MRLLCLSLPLFSWKLSSALEEQQLSLSLARARARTGRSNSSSSEALSLSLSLSHCFCAQERKQLASSVSSTIAGKYLNMPISFFGI